LRNVQRMPLALLRTASYLLRPFNPGVSAILAMGVAMEWGERTDVGERLSEFGVRPTTFAEYVQNALRA
jgi:hypothetical protein